MPTSTPTRPAPSLTAQAVLERYPLLTAHLICESLGYFSPTAAAAAIAAHHEQQPFACEWYIHMAGFSDKALLETGEQTLRGAYQRRHHHRGFMAEIDQAKAAVRNELENPYRQRLSSW